ncbi:hypothetical protein, partial [Pseudomonas sp. MONT-RG-20F-R14-05]|uniref:hypothetical protein n=1 Tax=Pseudomonas sp. MONT-RG-20F-R14-05 TaxID=2914835 RepID=UPI001F58AC91
KAATHDLTNTANPLWEPSSLGEAAKAVGQATTMLTVPPPSQPRQGSTAPTLDLHSPLKAVRNRSKRQPPI